MLKQKHDYDAIVIGSGISGGWAAKELSEKGLKTLILERGRPLEHIKDYPTTNKAPWEFRYRSLDSMRTKENYPIQSKNYAFNESTMHHYVNDLENPYSTPDKKPFLWYRGYHVGGKSLMWARQVYRWSELDFEANAMDGVGVDWPIRYQDIAPWYDYVEKFIGISGQKEGNKMIPDGQFQMPMEYTCVEMHVKEALEKNWEDRLLTIGRVAHLMEPKHNRSKCQFRNLCYRGCPFGAYFSSNSSTLPAAFASGNTTLRPHSIVESVTYDDQSGKAKGVKVLDAETGEMMEFTARVIFVNASTLPTTGILLQSTSSRFPEGLGNDSGTLGHYLMDHHCEAASTAEFDFQDTHYFGNRPNGIYIPRFRNVEKQETDYLRGFGIQGGSWQSDWSRGMDQQGFGSEFKNEMIKPGVWNMYLEGYGECLPYHDNQVTLNNDLKDKWGMSTLRIEADFKENELKMREDMDFCTSEILEIAGGKNIKTNSENNIPGNAIHEMGTARMGKDPKTSILNGFNQMHAVPNVFVTDGACMTSSACQNPSITYMALTARACAYAIEELKKQNI